MSADSKVTIILVAEGADEWPRFCRWCLTTHPGKQDGCAKWPPLVPAPVGGHKEGCDIR